MSEATPLFREGQRVRIQDRDPGTHHRVPNYAKGHIGIIERVCPAFGQPEKLCEGGDGRPDQFIYRVRLDQTALWDSYDGQQNDLLEIEIFEHWLEAVGEA